MRLHILPAQLSAALDVASKATAKRTTIPVLERVLLEATPDGGLKVRGTDLQRSAWHTVSARVDQAGSVALPPKPLTEFIASVSPDDGIEITVDSKHKAVLTSGRTVFKLSGLDPEEFPAMPAFDDPLADFTMAADVFARLVGNVAHAFLGDESRPALAGILLTTVGGALQLVTADGFRLAASLEPIPDLPDLSIIVQGRGLSEAARVFGGATSVRVLVDQQQSQLLIDSECGSWAVRLIEGQYPDWNRIVPKTEAITNVVTVGRAEAVRVSKLIRSLSVETTDTDGKGKTRTVMARLTVSPGEMTVTARDSTYDHEATAVIAAELSRGDGIGITFNGKYLLDALEAIDSARVTFEFTAPQSPTIVRPATDDSGHLCVLMPMHDARVKA